MRDRKLKFQRLGSTHPPVTPRFFVPFTSQSVPTFATRSLLPDLVPPLASVRVLFLCASIHTFAHGFSSGLLPPPFFFPRTFFFLAVLAAKRLHQHRSPRSSSPPTYLPVSLHACRPRGYVYTRVYARYACTSLETLIFREIISLRKAVSVPRLTAAAENFLESRQLDEAKELEASETAFMLVTHMYRCQQLWPEVSYRTIHRPIWLIAYLYKEIVACWEYIFISLLYMYVYLKKKKIKENKIKYASSAHLQLLVLTRYSHNCCVFEITYFHKKRNKIITRLTLTLLVKGYLG